METVGITRQKTRKEQLSPLTSVIDKLLIVELVKKFFRFIIITFARARLWTPLILSSILPTTSWNCQVCNSLLWYNSVKMSNVIHHFARILLPAEYVHGFMRNVGIQRAPGFILNSLICFRLETKQDTSEQRSFILPHTGNE
jgi:hypothetical protein